MFSIIIPLYNKELSIKNTIKSVINQSFSEFEIIIVNDGSTDNSVINLLEVDDSRIRIIHQENQGVSVARNNGINEAVYNWITFLDADDLWSSNHLEVLNDLIKGFDEDKVFTTSHTKSKLVKDYSPVIKKECEIIEDYFSIVLKNVDFLWTGAVCIHISVFETVGIFPVGISRGEDLYLWAKIGKNYRIVRSYKNTVTYKLEAENKLTNSISLYEKSLISLIDLKGLKGMERNYFKKLLISRMKQNIRKLNLYENLYLLCKHNVELVK